MSKVNVELGMPVVNGKQISFFCPCGSAEAECIVLEGIEYKLVDVYGKELAKKNYSWKQGALVSVIVDTNSRKAYVQNATSNAYIEDEFLHTSGGSLTGELQVGAGVFSRFFQCTLSTTGGNGYATDQDLLCRYYKVNYKGLPSEPYNGMIIVISPHADSPHTNKLVYGSEQNRDVRLKLGDDGPYKLVIGNQPLRKGECVLLMYNGTEWRIVESTRGRGVGTYTGTGESSSDTSVNRMANFDTGARGSNIIFIANDVTKGFLTPKGGVMFKDSGRSITSIGVYEVFGGNAESKAYYQDGFIQLRTNHEFINAKTGVYNYWCL